MFRAGMERMFTGDAGAVTYLFLALLLSVTLLGRCAFRTGRCGRAGMRELGGGLALLLTSRILFFSPLSRVAAWMPLGSFLSGSAGLYLVFVSLILPSARRKRFPFHERMLVAGLLLGMLLGGGLFTGMSGRFAGGIFSPMLGSFFVFVPAGMLVGALWESTSARCGCVLLPASGGAFFVTAAMLAGLSMLGILGTDPFWRQMLAMLDIAGFTTLLIATIGPGSQPQDDRSSVRHETECAKGEGAGPDVAPELERIEAIESKLTGQNNAQEIYDDIVRLLIDHTAAECVILRVIKAGDELFEVKAHTDNEEMRGIHPSAFSVSCETFERLSDGRLEERGYFLLSKEDTVDLKEQIVPRDLKWKGGRMLVVPIAEKSAWRGFITAGIFGDSLPGDAVRIFEYAASKVLQVVQREHSRDRIRESERSLTVCKEELESVNQLKSNFLSVVSHELRTPLTSVKAYTETLIDNIDTIKRETMKDFLDVMSEENERVISLVDNILNYSCMETGHLKVEKTPCDLKEMIGRIHGDILGTLHANDITSELRLPKHAVVIDADGELIRQLMQNLMSNAAKFTPAGGKIIVTLEEEASAARIVVQDTGRGIPEDQLEKIFERFHQVDASSTREHGGSGLGLAICKNIVDWHDGKIWVENVKDSGAKFVVLLPMKDIVVRQQAGQGFIGSVRFERERYLTLLVETVAEFIQARKASIMLLDREQQVLRIVAAKGLDPEFVQNTRVEVGDRIAGWVAQTGKPLHVFDIEKDVHIGRVNNTAFYGTHSFISVPVVDGNDVLGVINVSDHVDGREFTDSDRELLETLSPVIGGMLRKLEAYETVSMNFERLKDAMRSILDMREAWGSKNLSNLTILALGIGKRLGLDEESLTALRLGMNMYDLGMMKMPRSIRGKREELSDKEWEQLRQHTNIGYTLLSPMGVAEKIKKMVRSHHENFDGSGYPDGLVGQEIPVEARIVNVVDAFRALITEGPYRRCYSVDEARNEIIRGSGAKFDPKVIGAFVKALGDLGAVDHRCELVLEAVERELERQRKQRLGEGEKQPMVTVKEGTP